ncbi:MAG: hypothetical protein N3B16_05600 [Candidatus Aminicenantes bacterium]|nr:hypothetical protein [Candidatus Aminicenantes bacterium]
MPLTLNQFLWLVITLVIVVVATWLILFLHQLKRTAEEAEKALAELRHNLQEFNELQALIKEKAERVGETIESSRKIASNLAEILGFMTARVIRPSAQYWPLIFPLLQFLWRHKKKRKEKSHG